MDVDDVERFPLASRRARLLDDLDAATGGTFPVRIDACRPLRILPRIRADGTLDSVTILNCSIGDTDELVVRLRRPASRRAVWRDAKGGAAALKLSSGASPSEATVALSNLPGWCIGTIFFE